LAGHAYEQRLIFNISAFTVSALKYMNPPNKTKYTTIITKIISRPERCRQFDVFEVWCGFSLAWALAQRLSGGGVLTELALFACFRFSIYSASVAFLLLD